MTRLALAGGLFVAAATAQATVAFGPMASASYPSAAALRHLPEAPVPARSGLPEPELWTLLIVGLGGVGAAWRFGNPQGTKRR
jgi:hypothetical protein